MQVGATTTLLPPLLLSRRAQTHRLKTAATIPATIITTPSSDTLTHLANLSRLVRPPPAAPPPLHVPNLLSDPSQVPSPRRPISSRWRELHGQSDWSGLLHPLDSDLRRELLRYGDFIHSAYHAFLHHPRTVLLPDRSYRLTRHLFGTPSINLLPPRTPNCSNWIGFVAGCDNEREIRRMGRRDTLVTLRGTATFLL